MEWDKTKLLNINVHLNNKGTIQFKPHTPILTWEYIYLLTDWIENRYTNVCGRSFMFRTKALNEYAEPEKVYFKFIVEDTPPNILCLDRYRDYPNTLKFNAYNNDYKFNGFEMLYYIAQELEITHLFEYSNDFIKIVLSK